MRRSDGKHVVPAAVRRSELTTKLINAGRPEAEASTWTVVRVLGNADKFMYRTSLFDGKFTSTVAAKRAHILWASCTNTRKRKRKVDVSQMVKSYAKSRGQVKDDGYVIHLCGSAAALSKLSLATWKDISSDLPAVGDGYLKLVDVIIVDKSVHPQITIKETKVKGNWTKAGLLRLGCISVSRPSVVLEKGTHHILSMFLPGSSVVSLTDIALKFPDIHTTLHPNMNPHKGRPDLVMFGYRFNVKQRSNEELLKNLPTGYYCARTPQRATTLWRDERIKALIEEVASAMCRVERELSPAMAEHRMAHAVKSKHPGIMPGVSKERCSAPSFGISKGYVSIGHIDEGAEGMAECIVWLSRGMSKLTEYVFADVSARVMFDLVNDSESAICLIPGSELHGTPGLNPKFRGKHKGFGAVVINKANLSTSTAITDTLRVLSRLEGDIPTNPLLGSFTVDNQLKCKVCGHEGDVGQPAVCDECGLWVHCGGVTERGDSDVRMWYCDCCMTRINLHQKRARVV